VQDTLSFQFLYLY